MPYEAMGEENESKKVLNIFLFMWKGVLRPCDPWLEWPLVMGDQKIYCNRIDFRPIALYIWWRKLNFNKLAGYVLKDK